MPLSDQELDALEAVLFNDAWADDTLDYFGVHGAACASATGPCPLSDEEVFELIFGDAASALSSTQRNCVISTVHSIREEILQHLHEGTPIALPHEEEEDFEACLESWCAGYMEAFFVHEKAWFQKSEEIAAELLLPYMALSGLFDHDEFAQIHSNDKLMSQFEAIAAEQLTDIYLFYHAE